jgi:hypothetical protein
LVTRSRECRPCRAISTYCFAFVSPSPRNNPRHPHRQPAGRGPAAGRARLAIPCKAMSFVNESDFDYSLDRSFRLGHSERIKMPRLFSQVT